jgi:hypothetical protein
MNGGNWSVLDLGEDPVRGEPGAVRNLANASQQAAKRWEGHVQSLRTIASEGNAMEMEGEFAAPARQVLQAHPNAATTLARGRATVGQALLAYAGQLEQAKRESQSALRRGEQAKRNRDAAERNLKQVQAQRKQVQAQMRALSAQTFPYGPAYNAAVMRFNALRAQDMQLFAQEGRCINAWETAESQRMAARQQALAAGERAKQQESVAAQKVSAAAPTSAAARGSRGNGGTALRRSGGTSGSPGRRLPMNRGTVDSVAGRYGVQVDDLNIRIDKSRAGMRGATAPDGRVTLFRDAFDSDEQLTKTLVHERVHVEDLRNGMPYPRSYDAGAEWERRAEQIADDYWNNHPLNQ